MAGNRANPKTQAQGERVTATYNRAPVAPDKIGQCPCCLRSHRVVTSGRLVRHGWKETGRTVGQFGCGFQWGACVGHGLRPLEQTDEDALLVVERLDRQLKDAAEELAVTGAAGRDSYPATFEVGTVTDEERELFTGVVKRLLGEKVEPIMLTGRSGRLNQLSFRCGLARGFSGAEVKGSDLGGPRYGARPSYTYARIPSWEEARKHTQATLERLLKDLTNQRASILLAVEHHRTHPSDGVADPNNKGPAVHLYREVKLKDGGTGKLYYCGVKKWSVRASTNDPAQATCSRCKRYA